MPNNKIKLIQHVIVIVFIKNQQFQGDVDEIFSLLLKFISLLNEESNEILLNHQVKQIQPAYPKWLINLKKLAHCFFQISKFKSIQFLALKNIKQIFNEYKSIYGESMIRTLLSIFQETFEKELDEKVRKKAIQLLGYILKHSSNLPSNQIIEILIKQAKTPMGIDAVCILVENFSLKWNENSNTSVQILKIYHGLIELLNHQDYFVRKTVLQCLLQIKSDRQYKLLLQGQKSSFLQLDVSNSFSKTRKKPKIKSLNIHLLLNVLLNRILKETSAELFDQCLLGFIHMLTNNFMLAGCDLNLFVNVLQVEFKENKFASSVLHITSEQKLHFVLKAFHIIGLILIGYRRYLSRDQPFNLIELIIQYSIMDPFPSNVSQHLSSSQVAFMHQQIRLKCLQILSTCCIDFPAAISYKSSFLIHILDTHSTHEIGISNFLSCYLNSPKKLSRTLSEQELTTLFSIVSSLTSLPKIYFDFFSNHVFRLLVLLFQQCSDVHQKYSFYKNISKSLFKDSSCLLTESNLDFLSRSIFCDSVVDDSFCPPPSSPFPFSFAHGHVDSSPSCSPSDDHLNSILFSSTDPLRFYYLGHGLLSIQIGKMNWIKVCVRRASCRQVWITQLQNFPYFLHTYSKSQLLDHCFYDLFSSASFLSSSSSSSLDISKYIPPDVSHYSLKQHPFPITSDLSSHNHLNRSNHHHTLSASRKNIQLSMDEIKPTAAEIAFLAGDSPPKQEQNDYPNQGYSNSSPFQKQSNTELSLVPDLKNNHNHFHSDTNDHSQVLLSSVLLSPNLDQTDDLLLDHNRSSHPFPLTSDPEVEGHEEEEQEEPEEDEDDEIHLHSSSSFGFTSAFSPVDSRSVFLEDDEPLFLFEAPRSNAFAFSSSSSSTSGHHPNEHISLSYFYPPLPSYEEEEEEEEGKAKASEQEDLDPSPFLLDPSPEVMKKDNNQFIEDAQMMLHANQSPIIEHSLLNDLHSSLSVPVTSHFESNSTVGSMSASYLLQGSPMNSLDSKEVSSIIHPNKNMPATHDNSMAQAIIQQLESNTNFTKSSNGQFTIKKTRSITAPLRLSSDFAFGGPVPSISSEG